MYKIWVTTDFHFNHKKIIKYCNRPVNYEKRILSGLVKIPKDDILINLGDTCIGQDTLIHKQYIIPLKCKKILVRGNHDKKSNSWYMDNGWDYVFDEVVITLFGKTVLFSHKPRLDMPFNINIFGHFHNKPITSKFNYKIGSHYKLLSLEEMNYMPILVTNKFIERICNEL